jgi:hypothetical protein
MAKPNSTLYQQMLTTAADLDAQYSELIELRQRVQAASLTRYTRIQKLRRTPPIAHHHHALSMGPDERPVPSQGPLQKLICND